MNTLTVSHNIVLSPILIGVEYAFKTDFKPIILLLDNSTQPESYAVIATLVLSPIVVLNPSTG